jgi:hypothetical protein
MKKWRVGHIKKRAARAYHRVGGSDVVKRRDGATEFAKKHNLIYFHTISADADEAPVIRGSTMTHGQVDSNFCIGTHAGYDMALVERAVEINFVGFEPSLHRFYVLEIDLKQAHDLPFIFVGTKQLTKAFYAKVLLSHRNITYLQLDSTSAMGAAFHGHYALISSPSQMPLLNSLFTADVIDSMGAHKHPISIEVEDDSLIVFTDAEKPSQQLMDELLHYGLWLAKLVDERLT